MKNNPIKFRSTTITNGCMINAVLCQEAHRAHQKLKKAKVKSKLLHVDVEQKEGHAVCVFALDDEWFVYDINQGTYSIGKWTKQPSPKQIIKAMQKKNYKVSNPSWID